MYGSANEFKNDNNLLRNEVAFTNLIAVANNPTLFNALDPETQTRLIKIVCAYTKGCIDQVLISYNDDAEKIRSNIK